MSYSNDLTPLWLEIPARKARRPLRRDLAVDVAVIGGGVTGLTTAYLLAKAGADVAVFEAGRIGGGESGRSAGHLSHFWDYLPTDLARRYDEATVKAVWDGLAQAIEMVDGIVQQEALACDFARVPGYLYTADPTHLEMLEAIARIARRLGYEADQTRPLDLPFSPVSILRLGCQARIHPVRYLSGLAERLTHLGVPIYEETPIQDIEATAPVRLKTARGTEVFCEKVAVASHVPFNNRLSLHAKQTAYRTYMLGFRVRSGDFPDALFRDTHSPHHYMHLQRHATHDVLLVGGENHKTGHVDGHEHPFDRLNHYARRYLRIRGEELYRWSSQVLEPIDGLPLIGTSPDGKNEFVATGFSGEGLAMGTLAAHMLAERLLGRTTPWDERFDPHRSILHGVRDFVSENVDTLACIVRDRLTNGGEERSPAALAPGEGGIYRLGGQKLAIARLDDGRLTSLSPICTHLGGQVHWNPEEKTWDCPCHGSRYSRDGAVLNGPAVRRLDPVPLSTVTVEDEREGRGFLPFRRSGLTERLLPS